jgi:hypothetical protein
LTSFFEKIEEAGLEYITDYKPEYERIKKESEKAEEDLRQKKLAGIAGDEGTGKEIKRELITFGEGSDYEDEEKAATLEEADEEDDEEKAEYAKFKNFMAAQGISK